MNIKYVILEHFSISCISQSIEKDIAGDRQK